MELLKAKRMLPIHWGAFRLSLDPMEEPPLRFRQLLRGKRTHPKAVLWQPGDKIPF
jgi:L-ascorbate metabolism protein UlaG (beta-lactamase superfamily)